MCWLCACIMPPVVNTGIYTHRMSGYLSLRVTGSGVMGAGGVMSIIEELKRLIDPERSGGVSGFELKKAIALIEQLQNDVSEQAAEIERLRAALYPFQHPDFTKTKRPDNYPMWGFRDANLNYGDFRRAREIFTQSPTKRLLEIIERLGIDMFGGVIEIESRYQTAPAPDGGA